MKISKPMMTSPLFISLVALAAIGGLYGIWKAYEEKASPANDTLRVSFPLKRPIESYEPTKIFVDYEYNLLINLYSPLVEFDNNGVIQPSVAEKAYWDGNDLVFEIRKGLKTQSGDSITAEDVEFSLKRVLVLSSNTHGNFNDLLCPGVSLKSVDSQCEGLRRVGDKVILTPKSGRHFLLSMLTAMDFAIIPKHSVDPSTLKITDYSQTSGPYYVAKSDDSGLMTLKVNQSHFHAQDPIPKVIQIIPPIDESLGQSLEELEAGRVDHITTSDFSRFELVIPFAERNPNFNLHSTFKFKQLFMTFTQRGLRELSLAERKYISDKVKRAMRDAYKGDAGAELSDEYFPSVGSGGLTGEQRRGLAQSQKNLTEHEPSFVVDIGLARKAGVESWITSLRDTFGTSANVYQDLRHPEFSAGIADYKAPHARVFWTDTSFREDIGLVSYALNAGHFGLAPQDRVPWLKEYMKISETEERLMFLRELHHKALSQYALVPILAAPYTAIVRKPWRLQLSAFEASNPFWKIKYEE